MERNSDVLWRSIRSCLLSRQTNYAIIAVGLILFATGIVFILTAQANVIEKDLKLTPNSWRLNSWIDYDFNKTRTVYLINWTNHIEYFNDQDIAPNFEKIGPFVFKERNEVSDLNFDNELPSISFTQKRTWEFIPGLSSGNMSTRVTNVNFGAVSIAQIFDNEQDTKTARIVEFYLEREKIIITKTAGELLFDGYLDQTVKNLNAMFKQKKIDRKLPTDRFGWFVNKNNSYEGEFEVLTKSNLNVLTLWKGTKYTKYYQGSCGEVKGGLSEIIFTFERSGDKIFVFESDMCGSLPYSFDKISNAQGLNGYKYKAKGEYQSSTDTECFCNGNCTTGVLNISSCWNGLPVFMSYPAYENDSEQENYIIVEDMSGIPIEVHKTYQLNLLLKPYPYDIFSNLKSIYVPVIWYQDYWKIDPDFVDHIRKVLNNSSLFRIYGVMTIILGVSLWVARGFFSVLEWRRKQSSDLSTRTLLNDTLVPEED